MGRINVPMHGLGIEYIDIESPFGVAKSVHPSLPIEDLSRPLVMNDAQLAWF